ncbi:MAG: hypothetical protein ACE5D2_08290 [Fidelibacterota bacterium]
MGILFTIKMGILFTTTIGKLFTTTMGIQFTISSSVSSRLTYVGQVFRRELATCPPKFHAGG